MADIPCVNIMKSFFGKTKATPPFEKTRWQNITNWRVKVLWHSFTLTLLKNGEKKGWYGTDFGVDSYINRYQV